MGRNKTVDKRDANNGSFLTRLLSAFRKPKKMKDVKETVQDSIPIMTIHENENIIESYPGCYVKNYHLDEINYRTCSDKEQDIILTTLRSFYNCLGIRMECTLHSINRPMNVGQFMEDSFIKYTGTKWDKLIRQLNEILLKRGFEGKNGISKDWYLTIAIHADDLKKAVAVFKALDVSIDKQFKAMGSSATPVRIEERLEILHDIYNLDNRGEFLTKTKVYNQETGNTEEVVSFDFNNIRSMGITVNDVIGPSSIQYFPNYIRIGNQYARAIKVMEYPAFLSDDFYTDVTNMNFHMISAFYVKPLSMNETDALINSQLAYVREEKNNIQVRNRRNAVSEDMIPPETIEKENEILKLRDEIRENDEHLFETTLTFVVFAPTMELLDEYTDSIISECKKVSVTADVLYDQQEEGFVSTLPLAVNLLKVKRTLKSSTVAVVQPFSNLEIYEKDGINYSLNAISKNLILYNRLNKPNQNGFILGSSGSGKSFTAKTEIVFVFFKQNSDIMIIDPEQEYGYVTQALGGQIIPIMPGGRYHINPLDISMGYEYDQSSLLNGSESCDPILEKVSFISNLFGAMISENWGMDSVQKSLLDECLRELYSPFMKDGKLYRTPSVDETPTLNDMRNWFSKRKEPEARTLYYVLCRYAGEGTLNLFSSHTNVEIHNRIVCFDISSVGEELKLMAMNIIQDMCWARLVENKKLGKFTFIYVDELHIFFQPGNESAAEFLTQLWKRARKYGGVPTGITQSPADLLEHPVGKRLLSECNFIQILNQSSDENRERLKNILDLSDSAVEYITNAPIGQGLFYTGRNTVPFYSRFPEDNDIFPLLTSDMKQLREIEERKHREQARQAQEQRRVAYRK